MAEVEYAAAHGGKIADAGAKFLNFEFNDGERGALSFRLANVTKPLGSVSSVSDKGHRVVSDNEGSYVELKSRGELVPRRKGGKQPSGTEKGLSEAGMEAVGPELREARAGERGEGPKCG